jgi:mannose-6-phosphate isomerase-like protein (cupin superfamily)
MAAPQLFCNKLSGVEPKENHGILLYELLTEKNSDAKRTGLAIARVKPGAKMAAHYHFVTEEQFYFLEGNGKMKLDDNEIAVEKGTAVNIAPRRVHSLENTGRSDLVFVVISSPHYDPKDEKSA